MMPSALGIVRVLACVVPVIASAPAWAQGAGPIRLKADGDTARPISWDQREKFQTPKGQWASRLSRAEIERIRSTAGSSGEGGGGDVAGLFLEQYRHLDSTCDFPPECGGPCNVMYVGWTENTFNADGVALVIDDQEIGVVPGIPEEALPGDQGFVIWPFAAGDTVVRIEDITGGTVLESTFSVVDMQPFHDPQNVKCAEGGPGEQGSCELVISWENTDPLPTAYSVFINSIFQGNVRANVNQVIINAPPGAYVVALNAFLQVDVDKFHGGCDVSTTCELTCAGSACLAVTGLALRQIAYGPGPGDNIMDVEWQNGESPYGVGVNVTLDGGAADVLAGDAQSIQIDSLATGDHTISVQGDCGDPKGLATPADGAIKLLDASPHTTPVAAGGITCTFTPDPDADGPEVSKTVATWTSQSPSDLIDVFVVDGANITLVTRASGDSTSITINGTTGTEQFGFRFYATINGFSYASPLISCGAPPPPGNSYIQGLCSGTGDRLQISTAVFGLNYLFLGGAQPPCVKACDGNGDGQFNLSDMVYGLSYLFLGGPAPPLWEDKDADGQKDVTCTRAAPEDDCGASHEFCASAGG